MKKLPPIDLRARRQEKIVEETLFVDQEEYHADPVNEAWDHLLTLAEHCWSFRDREMLALLQAHVTVLVSLVECDGGPL